MAVVKTSAARLRLHAAKPAGEALKVVADQVGCPTSTRPGEALLAGDGIDANPDGPQVRGWWGAASWYDFAVAIGELAQAQGLLRQAATVELHATTDCPHPSHSPQLYSSGYASRQALGLPAVHWRDALAEVLARAQ